MKTENENKISWTIQMVLVFAFGLYMVYSGSHTTPFKVDTIESNKKLEFHGRYLNFYKAPTTREAYYAIIELDSFKYLGDYLPGNPFHFKGFYRINNEIYVKDSALVIAIGPDNINKFKPNGLAYTTIGDSHIHLELKDGRFWGK